jgi:16S rRNA (cytosine1402-N4)-methyltransferase
MNGSIHASVLLREVVDALSPRDGGAYVDATVGLGGHAEAILEASSPTGRLLGVDRDPAAIELSIGRLARFGSRASIVEGNFSDLRVYAEASDMFPADGLVADLGVSSMQLDDPSRGFSFMKKGPLDMRMGPKVGASAAELLEDYDEETLGRVLHDFGEVNQWRKMARAIIQARDEGKLGSTQDLAEVIEKASGGRKSSPIHPATRAFQAIRIAVNRELEELEKLLLALPELVRPGGRAAIISFHSLEDRLVKHAFEDPPPEPQPHKLPVEPVRKQGPWTLITKKPITPSPAEVDSNPRSRSAKMRIAERRGMERAA